MPTFDERAIAIEKQINRLGEQLEKVVTATEGFSYSEIHDSLFESLKRRIASMEKTLEVLQSMVEVAKANK